MSVTSYLVRVEFARVDMTQSIRDQASNLDIIQHYTHTFSRLELTMFVTPFIAYHAALRFVCSLRLHHIWAIATKVGAVERSVHEDGVFQKWESVDDIPTADSKAPRKKRVAMRPLKFLASAMKLRTAPQQKTITPANLPVGSLTKKYATTGCRTS